MDLDILTEHAVHDCTRFGELSLALQPERGLGDIVSADQEDDAGNDRAAEHPFPAIFDPYQRKPDESCGCCAQIPRSRDRTHRDGPVRLWGEFGYERGGDGVVCAYEETYREACQDQLERVGGEDREH